MKKYFTLSFDDGTMQDIRFVDMLNRYGLKCTFNLNSGLFGQKHRIVHDGIDVDHSEITADMAADLYKGHEIAVHTVHHPNLLQCDEKTIIAEVGEDKRTLEALCGYEITGMAYPGGPFYNEFVIETITSNTGIRYARTVNAHGGFHLPHRLMEWHPTCHQNDPNLFSLAERFLAAETDEADSDMLFYVWGHSFEFDKYQSWDAFERFCDAIAGANGISYVTNGEIAALY